MMSYKDYKDGRCNICGIVQKEGTIKANRQFFTNDRGFISFIEDSYFGTICDFCNETIQNTNNIQTNNTSFYESKKYDRNERISELIKAGLDDIEIKLVLKLDIIGPRELGRWRNKISEDSISKYEGHIRNIHLSVFSLPEEVIQLNYLEDLVLDANKLYEFPFDIFKIKNLNTVTFTNFEYGHPRLGDIHFNEHWLEKQAYQFLSERNKKKISIPELKSFFLKSLNLFEEEQSTTTKKYVTEIAIQRDQSIGYLKELLEIKKSLKDFFNAFADIDFKKKFEDQQSQLKKMEIQSLLQYVSIKNDIDFENILKKVKKKYNKDDRALWIEVIEGASKDIDLFDPTFRDYVIKGGKALLGKFLPEELTNMFLGLLKL